MVVVAVCLRGPEAAVAVLSVHSSLFVYSVLDRLFKVVVVVLSTAVRTRQNTTKTNYSWNIDVVEERIAAEVLPVTPNTR